MIRIARTGSGFEWEPLLTSFGFKGGCVDELWQTAALLEGHSGTRAVGLGVQSVLWSDAAVFASCSPPAGNAMMYLLTEYALRKAREIPFDTPMELLSELYPLVYAYGKSVTGNPRLRATFALNALVAVDNAAWLLYCRENAIESFDMLIPASMRPALSCRHRKLAAVPLISYGNTPQDAAGMLDQGFFFLKIKIGSDPEGDADPEKMLAWDMRRLSAIHALARDRSTRYTENGYIPYYLDANGRYGSKDQLLRLLDYADHIGALERIILLEEPFPEEYRVDVSDIPVRIAADESAHCDRDALERIELGYGAIALKPIAKTLSMSLRIAQTAHERGVPCFCADLTVNPVLVDWNKNVAARLAPLPGMKVGVLETNGQQNYRNWRRMQSYHPCCGAPWMQVKEGLFALDDDFYRRSGGIFGQMKHYESLANGGSVWQDT
jgi:L-alanine-DL-glutamate epimerase-like enolase superfamily enzyme